MIGLLIPGWLKRAVAWALGGLVVAAGIFGLGRREGRLRAKSEAEKGYRKTREKIDEADIVGDDPDRARRWLHERDANQR